MLSQRLPAMWRYTKATEEAMPHLQEEDSECAEVLLELDSLALILLLHTVDQISIHLINKPITR